MIPRPTRPSIESDFRAPLRRAAHRWLSVAIGSLNLLLACGGGGGSGGGTVPAPNVGVHILDGRLVPGSGGSLPINDVVISVEATGETVRTDSAGRFQLRDVPATRIFASFPDASQNVYQLGVDDGEFASGQIELSTEPVFGRTSSAGISLSPPANAAAPIASVVAPPDGASVTCTSVPCRILVRGTATTFLGMPTTYNIYVLLIPVSPAGGGAFPQFPPVSVDPTTGEWITEVQLGANDTAPRPGDLFQILAVVTSATLKPGTPDDPLSFPRPIDVPGVVHVSAFNTITVTGEPSLGVGSPASQASADCVEAPGGCRCRFDVGGTFEGFNAATEKIHVLVRPTEPFGGGWFLQPGTAVTVDDGRWSHLQAFLGSEQFPACDGDVFSVAAIATSANVDRFLGATPFELEELPPHLLSNIAERIRLNRSSSSECEVACTP